MTPAMRREIEQAAERADWMQVVLNQGPPCFHLDDGGSFCFRAERWDGHKAFAGPIHAFVSLADLFRALLTENAALRTELEAAHFVRAKIEKAGENAAHEADLEQAFREGCSISYAHLGMPNEDIDVAVAAWRERRAAAKEQR